MTMSETHRPQRWSTFGEEFWKCRTCGQIWDEEHPDEPQCPGRVIGVQARCTDCDIDLAAVGREISDHVFETSHSVSVRHVVVSRRAER